MATSSNPKSLEFIHVRKQKSTDSGTYHYDNLGITVNENEVVLLQGQLGISHDGGFRACVYGLYGQSPSSVAIADVVQLGEGTAVYPDTGNHSGISTIRTYDLVDYFDGTMGGTHGQDSYAQVRHIDIPGAEADVENLIASDVPKWFHGSTIHMRSYTQYYTPPSSEFAEFNLYFYRLRF